ncbi:MAG: hypothetical protein L6V93_07650 [Clostridiales bacterium]|nr:MAG: hypothetical protein L6V93_07650 [Clostridiales bacterium]
MRITVFTVVDEGGKATFSMQNFCHVFSKRTAFESVFGAPFIWRLSQR